MSVTQEGSSGSVRANNVLPNPKEEPAFEELVFVVIQ